MKSKYTTKVWGDQYTVEADFAHASSPILFNGESTPHRVADFAHDPEEAMRENLEQMARDSGGLSEQAETEIEAALGRMEEEVPPFFLSATALDSNGVRVDAGQPEVLGEFLGRRYASRAEAEGDRQTAEEEAREFFPSAEVTIEEA